MGSVWVGNVAWLKAAVGASKLTRSQTTGEDVGRDKCWEQNMAVNGSDGSRHVIAWDPERRISAIKHD